MLTCAKLSSPHTRTLPLSHQMGRMSTGTQTASFAHVFGNSVFSDRLVSSTLVYIFRACAGWAAAQREREREKLSQSLTLSAEELESLSQTFPVSARIKRGKAARILAVGAAGNPTQAELRVWSLASNPEHIIFQMSRHKLRRREKLNLY